MRGDGAPLLLQQAEGQEGPVVARGRREARQVHHRPWPWLLELSPKTSWYVRADSPLLRLDQLAVSFLTAFCIAEYVCVGACVRAGLQRCGKSCRLRWLNYLRPNIKHGDFTPEEDSTICKLYISIGSRCIHTQANLLTH